jgi:chorismate synthase
VQFCEVKHARVRGSGEFTRIVVQGSRAPARTLIGRVAAGVKKLLHAVSITVVADVIELGGISIGAPIVCTISVKPTPSIAKQQSTVDLARSEAADIEIKGRHDPAIPPRIVPVAEAMAALVLADHLLRWRAGRL